VLRLPQFIQSKKRHGVGRVETRDSRKPFVVLDKNEMKLAEGGLQDLDYQEVTAVSQAGLKFLSKMDFRRDRATAVTV
jgi:hypothetical protein